ncbi:50S ribosomal protein L29 [Buchnera aphidicola]|uniref:Large ribosomal subunit protein uL29 n=1 Tax=Buchnera aphidicola (Cinara strobi) TaxID=1921549 RepID=A0A3B1DMA1_9GAMM|nr:50S ribosomal protein L29 [Buchnera aphidicola]VAX76811.1 50S ribosomal protein L29 [Buchnera aphidicola (Cinara strobi)]
MRIIRKKSINKENLKNQLINLLKEQFNIRLQLASGKLKKTHLIRQVRKKIACIKTLLIDRISNEL